MTFFILIVMSEKKVPMIKKRSVLLLQQRPEWAGD
jgi:hypothetical protein